MKTFYDEFSAIDRDRLRKISDNCNDAAVERALSTDNPSFNDYIALLSPAAEKHLDEMAELSSKITKKHFGKNIQLYIPMYISNECENMCAYCGFKKSNKVPRKTLSIEEIRAEFESIKRYGFENVLILTGEAPGAAGLEYISEVVKIAREFFVYVALEIFPMDTKGYRSLVDAGATGVTLYQETYDPEVYDKVHIAGEKKDFKSRLEAPERALDAGVRKMGIGALLGLSEWRMEAAFLGAHAKYLMKKYWRADIGISFPRLRGSSSGFKPFSEVEDKDLVQMIFALRIYLYHAGITISTREPAEFRDNMIGLGVTMMSAGSKTNPGGYETYEETEKQFEICDDRSVKEITDAIKAKGFYPVFKDWDDQFGGVRIESAG